MEAMMALGPVRATGMGGVRPADWSEIYPFMQATGAISEAWEAEALHEMCAAFSSGLESGKNPFAIPPIERDRS
jgi:hypothetical protein